MNDAGMNDHEKNTLDTYKDMSVGEVLKRAREAQGVDVAFVSDRLKIRRAYLEALESDDITVLPGRVYAIGFVRSYADFLGLDGEKIVYLFKNQKVGHTQERDLSMPTPLDDGQIPGKKILFSCAAALIVGYIGYALFFGKGNPETTEIPEAPIELVENGKNGLPPEHPIDSLIAATEEKAFMASEAVTEEAEDVAGLFEQGAAEVQEKAAAHYQGLEIKAAGESWISIRDKDGNSLAAKLMKADDVYQLPLDAQGPVLNTGNIGDLEFFLAGTKIDVGGKAGEVRKNMKLDTESLKSLQSQAKTSN